MKYSTFSEPDSDMSDYLAHLRTAYLTVRGVCIAVRRVVKYSEENGFSQLWIMDLTVNYNKTAARLSRATFTPLSGLK